MPIHRYAATADPCDDEDRRRRQPHPPTYLHVRRASSTVPICANRTALADHVPDVETARAYVPKISRMRSP